MALAAWSDDLFHYALLFIQPDRCLEIQCNCSQGYPSHLRLPAETAPCLPRPSKWSSVPGEFRRGTNDSTMTTMSLDEVVVQTSYSMSHDVSALDGGRHVLRSASHGFSHRCAAHSAGPSPPIIPPQLRASSNAWQAPLARSTPFRS